MAGMVHKKIKSIGLWLLLLCATISVTAIAQEAPDEAVDVRVLIDISGSMKNNDPRNLRRPALRLLVGLLPQKTRAGVWTFGQYVNMQVPLGQVDNGWKKRAREGASQIHSRGLYTNIGEALKRASADWEGLNNRYQRHMILLTDGMVDISKNQAKNQSERRRIIEQQLPDLEKLGVKIHTIALSENADHELMKLLAESSSGWYEQVADAEQLQRIFLRIFEKVGKPNLLPLRDNRFVVDKSVQEVTLLVFRSADASPSQVVTPEGKTFGSENAPPNVNWHRDDGYDLLTIQEPAAGEWLIKAAVDPDNRVMVVSDLKMEMGTLPNLLVRGVPLVTEVEFTNEGERITKQDFLSVVSVTGEYQGSDGSGEPWPIDDDGQGGDKSAADGAYGFLLAEGIAAGKAELVVKAQGKTFQRERRHYFELVEPVEYRVEQKDEGGVPGVLVSLTALAEQVNSGSVTIDASLDSSDGESSPQMFLPAQDGTSWTNWIDRTLFQGERQLNISVSGQLSDGQSFSFEFDPVPVAGLQKSAAKDPEATQQPAMETEDAPEKASPEPEPETDYVMIGAIFGGVNLILLLAGGVGIWVLRKRLAHDRVQLVDEKELEALNSKEPEQQEPDQVDADKEKRDD